MSTHVRAQIRGAVVTELKKITAFGNRVYPYRVNPLITTPGCVVTTPEDKVDPEKSVFASGGPVDYHELTIRIAIYTKAADGIDDDLDGYAVSVEQKMMADETFGGLLRGLQPESAMVVTIGDLEEPAGTLVMIWTGVYFTKRGTPTTAI